MRDLVDELLQSQVKARLFGRAPDGPTLGRLRILSRLGAGAMGTVFAAHDPRLDRTVAVKVLQPGASAARVLTEARALARLRHPHVITVHDADELDGLVYIVMELVSGPSLRAWLQTEHSWRQEVIVLREAATGLAAAHAAGLVHRDIKPDNILVGEDRARIGDFGLASTVDDGSGSARPGTPVYMAPEVRAGAAASAASDQYSFGVTLHEAVHGARPGGPGGNARRDVPGWLDAVIARALRPDPAERYPSMDALVAALDAGLGEKRRRRGQLLVAATVTALAVAGVTTFVAVRRSHANPCTGGAARVATAWTAEGRQRIAAALASTPWSAQTLAALDASATAWQDSYRRVCEATRVRGEQSDSLLDLRMRCLDHVLARFSALDETIAPTLDAAGRSALLGAIAELPAAASCETLTSPGEVALPADPAQRTRALAAEHDLDRAWAAFALGRHDDARTAVARARAAISGLDAPRLRAEVLTVEASVAGRTGDPAAARALLDEALLAAASAAAPRLEHDVWTRRLRNELFGGEPAKVLEWATFARAAASRAGLEGAEIDGIVAEALRSAGKLGEAAAMLERALASTDPLRADQRAVIEMNLGSVQLALGDSTAALATLGRARDRVLAAYGDHHPDLALYGDKLAAADRARGQIREALRWHEASLGLRVAAFGDQDRAVATALLGRAQTNLEAGDYTSASRDALQALHIRERVFGATSARLGEVYAVLGDIDAALGKREAAQGEYDRAAALDPRLELVARRAAVGIAPPIQPVPAADAVLSVEQVAALAAQPGSPALAAALRARFRPELDPALGDAIGAAQLAAGDRAAAAEIYAAVARTLRNEPTRTALRVFIGLARSSDAQGPQAARAAIALYQAMPSLERGAAYDEMWALSKR